MAAAWIRIWRSSTPPASGSSTITTFSRDSLDSRIRLNVKAGQTYTVLAEANGQTAGDFGLTLATVATDDYGNTVETAKRKGLDGGARAVDGTINYSQDVDMLAIVANRTGTMQVALRPMGTDTTVQYELAAVNAQGQTLSAGQTGVGQESVLSFEAIQGQTYYLSATGADGMTGRYRMTIRNDRTDQLPSAFELADSVDLPVSGTVEMAGQIGQAGQSDMYTFTPRLTAKVSVEVLGASGLNANLQLYDAKGRRITWRPTRGAYPTKLEFQGVVGQTYYLLAAGTGLGVGAYSLSFTSAPKDDYANTLEAAYAMSLNGSAPAASAGRSTMSRTFDTFAVTATVSGTMQVNMTATGRRNNLDCVLYVYNAQGQMIARNDDSGNSTNSMVSFDVVAGQRYFLKACAYGTTTGTYTLTAATQPAPSPPAGAGSDARPDPDAGSDFDARSDPDAAPGRHPGHRGAADRHRLRGLAGRRVQFWVLGTDSADTIVLSPSGDGISLTTSAGTQNFQGAFTAIVIYGFGGDDVIRLTNDVTVNATVDAGAGNDTIYDAGRGKDSLYGGLGDDMLVSVGGGMDNLYGQGGQDSFWMDSADTAVDASSSEITGGYVHQITEFYQPYTTDPNAAQYVGLEIAGQNFTDPTPTSSYAMANFANLPLFVNGPQYNDIAQGNVGDCYFLSSLASLAYSDPAVISQSIASMGDGTYVVRFRSGGGDVYLRLDADLPVNGGGTPAYARFGPNNTLWAPLMEKAYAYYRYGSNSYASINGGWMADVYQAVTGQTSSMQWVAQVTGDQAYSFISNALSHGNAVTAGTNYNASGPIVGSHAYMVKSVQTVDGVKTVTVYNPWGVDGGTSSDPNRGDGLVTLTMSQFSEYFMATVACLA